MKNKGVYTYRGRVSQASQEKGVDVSIAVDLIRLTYEKQYDVAIIISQDWDYGPAVKLAKLVAKEQGRRLDFESCFPYEPHISADRGIPGTMWIKIDKALYDSCLDSRDYRYTP